MDTLKIDGFMWAKMVNTASAYLTKNKSIVDALNVFPVPDGDTGTNMSLTYQSASKYVNAIDEANAGHFGMVADAMSQGALLGARGNSGVISSQILAGFSAMCKNKAEIDASDIVISLEKGVDNAYKAVMKPTEGTILTVSKAVYNGARKAHEAGITDVVEILKAGEVEGKEALSHTPDMLPILKQAGVVDAGGQGFLFILHGLIAAITGEDIDVTVEASIPSKSDSDIEDITVTDTPMDPDEIVFGYCTEFVVKNKEGGIDLDKTREYLGTIGDCVLVVGTDSVMKVHVHTNHPGKAFEWGLNYGSLHKMKIDNLREEAEAKQKAEMHKIGIISVAAGSGIEEILKSLGVHRIIKGGQTMNPSTEDFVKAIKSINAREIIILPNNSNIIMAATQAAKVSEKIVHIVPSKTIPQGIAALMCLNEQETGGENARRMTEAMKDVITLEVTYAVRDANYEDKIIKQGDILGLKDGKLSLTGSDKHQTVMDLLEKSINEDHYLLTIYYGEDETEEEAEALAKLITEKYDFLEIDIHQGNQPLYYYLISLE